MLLKIPFSFLSDFLPSFKCLGLSLCEAESSPGHEFSVTLPGLSLTHPGSSYYDHVFLSGFFPSVLAFHGPLPEPSGQRQDEGLPHLPPRLPGCITQAWVPAQLGRDRTGMEALSGEQGRAPTHLKSTFV